jgi:mRNA interferase MazF
MPSFSQGDVIKVPFPYTDRSTRQSRPALVVSAGGIEDAHGLLWVMMITSAENRGWPGDVPVSNLALAGLPVPSVIRTAKIATIEAADAAKLGRVSPAVFRQVARRLAGELGLDARQ